MTERQSPRFLESLLAAIQVSPTQAGGLIDNREATNHFKASTHETQTERILYCRPYLLTYKLQEIQLWNGGAEARKR